MAGTATVAFLFVDLVGSTEILSRIGDDANDEVRTRYLGVLRDAVTRAEGAEVKSMGDGMMVAFERSVADAVRCAIDMQRTVDRLRGADPLLALQIRIGISVGEAAPQDRDWHGTPVVEAARLESKARPGQILANDVVRHLLGNRGSFDCTPVGEYELKGFPEPLACCEIAWEPDPGLPDIPLPAGLGRSALALAGRADELGQLRTRWDSVHAGAGATVVVAGEPGVGKTRLASELGALVQRGGATVLYGRCDTDSALADQPVAEALRWYAAACAPAALREQLAGDGRVLLGLVPSLAARIPDLAHTAEVVVGRDDLVAAIRAFLTRVAAENPVLLVVDDLHNASMPTNELVTTLAAAPPPGLMLLAISRRSDELRAVPGVERMSLTGLTRDGVVELVRGRVGLLADPPDVDADALAATIVAETGGNPQHVLDVLERATAGDALYTDSAGQVAAVRTAAAETCPYKGLLAFQYEDADLFFGRDDDVATLVSRLAGQRLLAVVGASGSGKSSVVRAGVLPALRRGALAGSERWPIVTIAPGPHPAAELAAACAVPLATTTGALLERLESDPSGFAAAVNRAGAERLVVFVDQFEETFTLCNDATERSRFVDALLSAAAAPGGPVLVVLAMRADFFGYGASVPGLAAALESSTSLLGPMDEDGLRAAIEGPARVAGLKIEPGLVDLMLRDVAGEPGSLPLLSHALLETWKRRSDRTLTVAGYRECGGVRGAIARTAESVYLSLDVTQQALARTVFVRLTELGEGTEDTRRRVPLDELRSGDGASPALDQLLRTLTDARLLTTSDHTVEVAHEALIREWPRLRAWLDDDREGIRTLRHVTDSARAWDELARDPAELYRGPRLAAAVEWSERTPDTLNPLEQDFLDAGRDAADRERRESERRTRRLRVLFAATAIALVLALIGGGFALRQTNTARDQAHEADVQRLVGQSTAVLDTKRDLGLLLAVEANRRRDRLDTRGALQTALVREPTFLGYLRGGKSSIQAVGFTGDGKQLVLGGNDGTITVVDVTTHQPIGAPIPAVEGPIAEMVAASNGTVFALGGASRGVAVVDLATHKRLRTLSTPQPIGRLALSSDGSRLAAGGYVDPPEQPKVFIWDTKTMELTGTLAVDPGNRTDGPNGVGVAFSSKGLLAVSGPSQAIQLFDGASLTPVARFPADPATVGIVLEFSPDGTRLMSGNARQPGLMLWDVNARRPAWPKRVNAEIFSVTITAAHDVVFSNRFGSVITLGATNGEQVGQPISLQRGSVCDLAVSPDARTLAVGDCNEPTAALLSLDSRSLIGPIAAADEGLGGYSPDGRMLWTVGERGITIRDAQTFRPLYHAPGYQSAGFTADSKYLIAVRPDAKGGLYDFRAGRFVSEPRPIADAGHITAAALDPRSARLALGYNDGHVAVLDRAGVETTPRGIRVGDQSIEETQVHGLSFSPDGKLLAVADQDELTKMFDTTTGKQVGEPIPRAANALISPDGNLLAAAAFDGTIAFYNAQTLKPAGPSWAGSRVWSGSLAFSRDGRLLATVALDSSARVFDVNAREVIGAPFPVATDTPAALRPDGKALALQLDAQGTPRTQVWTLEPAAWREAACLAAGRNLTRAEWAKYVGGSYRATCPQWPAAA